MRAASGGRWIVGELDQLCGEQAVEVDRGEQLLIAVGEHDGDALAELHARRDSAHQVTPQQPGAIGRGVYPYVRVHGEPHSWMRCALCVAVMSERRSSRA